MDADPGEELAHGGLPAHRALGQGGIAHLLLDLVGLVTGGAGVLVRGHRSSVGRVEVNWHSNAVSANCARIRRSRPIRPDAPLYLGTVPVLLAIALGGALGSLARWGVAEACVQAGLASGPADWPWATLLVNVIGALAIGAVLSSGMLVGRPRWLGAFLVTGILGGFTTFSALALETVVLLDGGRAGLALGYVALTVIVGLLAVRLGSRLATHRRGA